MEAFELIRNKMDFYDRIRIDNSKKKYGWYDVVDDKIVVHLTNRKTSKTSTIKWMRDNFGFGS